MRSLYAAFLMIPILLTGQRPAEALRKQKLQKLTHESGSISYSISGDAKGSEKLYFDDYGWKSAKMQTMTFELYEIESRQTLKEITDGDYVYRLNMGDSTYTERINKRWSELAAYKNPEEVSEAMLFSMGGSQASADSTLLDRQCTVWTFENKALQEMWLWKGLVMKRKVKLGDLLVVTTAEEVSLGSKPDHSLFHLPIYFTKKDQ